VTRRVKLKLSVLKRWLVYAVRAGESIAGRKVYRVCRLQSIESAESIESSESGGEVIQPFF